MKKLITTVLLAAFVLSACGNNDVPSNTIVNAELTEREKTILSATTDQTFIFDFTTGSEFNELDVWIEKYEFGKLVDEPIGHIRTEIEEKGSIFFTTNQSSVESNEAFFRLGISSNGSTGSSALSDIISNKDSEGMQTVWDTLNEEIDITNDELVLGSICYSWDEAGMSSLSSEFYHDVEGRMHEIEKYEVVYLLRSKFMN
ncbi:hypothetical protein BTR22_10625 [Alkalihalophilus pseudofirmus]|nr:hypothetical protein BTR22_10625 [Alkalihalophilus pseudofirmus]